MTVSAPGILSAKTVQRMRRPDKLGSPAPVSAPRIEKINAMRQAGGPLAGAWSALVNDNDPTRSAPYTYDRIPGGVVNPYVLPNVYDTASETLYNTNIQKIRYDGIAAYNFALRYAIAGDTAAAAAAVAQIDPWLGVNDFDLPSGSDTRLSWSNTWPLFIAAGMMLRGSAAWTTGRENGLKAVTQLALTRNISTSANASNQGAWGVVFELAAAAQLEDSVRFAGAVSRWRALLDDSTGVIAAGHTWCNVYLGIPNDPGTGQPPPQYADCACPCHSGPNVPTHEVHRQSGGQGNGSSGLYYSDFLLTALTYGAEWARFNGVWLYDYVTPGGSSLKGVYEKIAGWCRNPATFTYNTSGSVVPRANTFGAYEILNALWPNDDAAWILANKPFNDVYSLKYLTLTHRGQELRG
ncbi:alginate lyase family protein [Microbacterium trichothecenolyticum]|uniref:alginate lyase family protein n=1 Tax=Microbacterium trichothecenolyticum TaxID=69370 RepID=UPI001C6DD9FD|nr:alginate lyase family protein [Microbacterium trichothecenolyticum]MBW9118898.1 alginate lyase family protein [Microbacterium trichothecenolyticum]